MDPCDAEYNATSYHNQITGERCFPLAVFLMCWFHVEFNVGKHIISKGVPKELIPMVKMISKCFMQLYLKESLRII